nr:MAG TPA: hypothetical protein [Caudoviricetes sp.]
MFIRSIGLYDRWLKSLKHRHDTLRVFFLIYCSS